MSGGAVLRATREAGGHNRRKVCAQLAWTKDGPGFHTLAKTGWPPHLTAMVRSKLAEVQKISVVRTILFCIGILLMLVSPAVGLLPGPGGILVFGAGLALTLKYSEWAKRQYVQFKRKHPRKGSWADWGLRRRSARRREARRRALEQALEPGLEQSGTAQND